MSWKDMVVMDEQALEAQGVAALGARGKILKTFEVIRRKMGINDPTAPPSGGPTPLVNVYSRLVVVAGCPQREGAAFPPEICPC
jgi:hypothetical protein